MPSPSLQDMLYYIVDLEEYQPEPDYDDEEAYDSEDYLDNNEEVRASDRPYTW